MELKERSWEGVDLIHLVRKGIGGVCCEYGNGPLCSTKGGQFRHHLNVLSSPQGGCCYINLISVREKSTSRTSHKSSLLQF